MSLCLEEVGSSIFIRMDEEENRGVGFFWFVFLNCKGCLRTYLELFPGCYVYTQEVLRLLWLQRFAALIEICFEVLAAEEVPCSGAVCL